MTSIGRFNSSEEELEEIGFDAAESELTFPQERSSSGILIFILVLVCLGGYFYFVGLNPVAAPSGLIKDQAQESPRSPSFTAEESNKMLKQEETETTEANRQEDADEEGSKKEQPKEEASGEQKKVILPSKNWNMFPDEKDDGHQEMIDVLENEVLKLNKQIEEKNKEEKKHKEEEDFPQMDPFLDPKLDDLTERLQKLLTGPQLENLEQQGAQLKFNDLVKLLHEEREKFPIEPASTTSHKDEAFEGVEPTRVDLTVVESPATPLEQEVPSSKPAEAKTPEQPLKDETQKLPSEITKILIEPTTVNPQPSRQVEADSLKQLLDETQGSEKTPQQNAQLFQSIISMVNQKSSLKSEGAAATAVPDQSELKQGASNAAIKQLEAKAKLEQELKNSFPANGLQDIAEEQWDDIFAKQNANNAKADRTSSQRQEQTPNTVLQKEQPEIIREGNYLNKDFENIGKNEDSDFSVEKRHDGSNAAMSPDEDQDGQGNLDQPELNKENRVSDDQRFGEKQELETGTGFKPVNREHIATNQQPESEKDEEQGQVKRDNIKWASNDEDQEDKKIDEREARDEKEREARDESGKEARDESGKEARDESGKEARDEVEKEIDDSSG